MKISDKGQSLILVAIAMLGFMAMLALVLDGGNLWAKRRAAQNAADAGALAGAAALCSPSTQNSAEITPVCGVLGSNPTDAELEAFAECTANYYAVNRNEATSAVASASNSLKIVTVHANIVVNTFFAHLIGWDTFDAGAVAEAGCDTGGGSAYVLPVAWTCKDAIGIIPPTEPPGGEPNINECEQEVLTPEELYQRVCTEGTPGCNPPSIPEGGIDPDLFIIMDNDDIGADFCYVYNCDTDGDGKDNLSNGNRAWLNLDGGAGNSAEMVDWIHGYEVVQIDVHDWLSGTTGDRPPIFSAVNDHVGQFFTIPVFDRWCPSGRPNEQAECVPLIHDGIDDLSKIGEVNDAHFHIAGFSVFYVKCVANTGGSRCPGNEWAANYLVSLGVLTRGQANTLRTIEGYFVTGFPVGLGGGGGGGMDLGTYRVYLRR